MIGEIECIPLGEDCLACGARRAQLGARAGAIAVGYRLLTAPFCMGFAGIEAFCAFLAVATHRICQPRQESLFERNAAG